MGGRIALAQSGFPSLLIAASSSPGVGMVMTSLLTALESSSGVKAGPLGDPASSAARRGAEAATTRVMNSPAASVLGVLIMILSLGKRLERCRCNIARFRLRRQQ